MLRIYGLHTPMFIKTVLAAEELGLTYEVVPVDLMKGETRTPEHLKRHPFGKMPVLEHNGAFIFESNAILRYMGDLADSTLYPRERMARAQVDQWLDYYTQQMGRWIGSVWFQRCIGPKYFDEPADEKQIAEYMDSILTDMPVIDARLKEYKYIAGNSFTLADVNAYVLCSNAADAGLNFSDFPNYLRWQNEMASRDAVKKVYAKWG